MEGDPDHDLVERCRRDEVSALRELVERFQHVVYGPIARAVPDASRAEQLAQEVFLRIHGALPYFRGGAPLSVWVARTVADVCPDVLLLTHAQERQNVPVPPQFAVRTLARIRRDRWRREQLLDVAFNAAIALVALATLAVGWYFVDASGLSGVGSATLGLVGAELSGVARSVAPSLPGYVAAAALIAMVLIAWWWAER